MKRWRVTGIAGAAVLIASTCTVGTGSNPASPSTDLVVFAAASLKAPLERIATTYEAAHPGVEIALSLDSSAALRTQVEQGAPADLFLSADLVNPQRLVDAALGKGPVVAFAGNAVVIAAPMDSLADETWLDLGRDDVAIVAAGAEVPVTAYATQLVAQLAAAPGADPAFAAGYERNIVSREDNVRAVVAKLELGEGDAGIVYRTDAIGSPKLRTVALPDGVSVAVSYGAIVVERSGRQADAAAFLGWLSGVDGQAILAEFGFVPVS